MYLVFANQLISEALQGKCCQISLYEVIIAIPRKVSVEVPSLAKTKQNKTKKKIKAYNRGSYVGQHYLW